MRHPRPSWSSQCARWLWPGAQLSRWSLAAPPDPLTRRRLISLDALCEALATRPERRSSLGEPGQVLELLHDIATTDHKSLVPKNGATRRTIETLLAMQR